MLTSEVLSNDDELRGVDHKVVDRGKVDGDVVQVDEVRRWRMTNTFLLPELSWSSPEIVHF